MAKHGFCAPGQPLAARPGFTGQLNFGTKPATKNATRQKLADYLHLLELWSPTGVRWEAKEALEQFWGGMYLMQQLGLWTSS